jgi:hypothetical protein
MRFDRGFFGLPIFIFPPFNPEFCRDRDDFIFDERYRNRYGKDRRGQYNNRGFNNRPYR